MKAEIPVIDLHCDLLSFLSHKSGRSIDDPSSRTSHSQLSKGRVKLQTLAIFSITDSQSVEIGRSQVEHYLKLISLYPTLFAACRLPFNLETAVGPQQKVQDFEPQFVPMGADHSQKVKATPTGNDCGSKDCAFCPEPIAVSRFNTQNPIVGLIPAFENASAFASEDEPLSNALGRLEEYCRSIGPVFYITMTWNEENRFGGGNMTNIGLKDDGKRLLEWMDGKRIAIDLSHTSDKLAYDIINFIDKNALGIPLIASHSNFRAISDWQRNLPDDLAKEIIRRKGLIGLNLFAPFIHQTDPSAIIRHVEYGLSLGGERALSFGADFFCDKDFPSLVKKYQRTEAFYPEFADSSAYPSLLELFTQKIGVKEDQLLKIASQNALYFLKDKIFLVEMH